MLMYKLKRLFCFAWFVLFSRLMMFKSKLTKEVLVTTREMQPKSLILSFWSEPRERKSGAAPRCSAPLFREDAECLLDVK